MLQAFESQKKTTNMLIAKERKEYKELIRQKSNLDQELNKKANILKEKTERMAELIDKAKKYSDPNTQELLNKWEKSNQHMKEAYDNEINGLQQKKESTSSMNAKNSCSRNNTPEGYSNS